MVAGRLDVAELTKLINEGNGKAELKTVNGGILTVVTNGANNFILKDANGGMANIIITDVNQ